jgi:hypothetical protein
MTVTVHGGSLGRWFEELCRIKYQRLREVATATGDRLASGKLPSTGGVYVFWWTGDDTLLSSPNTNRYLELQGPAKRPVLLQVDDEWLGLSTKLPIPLYVGKNADSLVKRVRLHLLLARQRLLPLGGGASKAQRPTTTCQLRAGVEHFFPNEQDTRTLILDNIGLSFVALHGDAHAANRFLS